MKLATSIKFVQHSVLVVVVVLFQLLACSAIAAPSPRIAVLIGEDEYHTWETLPEYAESELKARGFNVTIIQEDPQAKHHFPGLVEALKHADLLLVSTRRRLPPKDQLDAVRVFLDAGKPMVGIRTACHAFSPPLPSKKNLPDPLAGESWIEFDPQVIGGHYVNHYPALAGMRVTVATAPGAETSPILKDVQVSALVGNGTLYRVNPLDPSCTLLLMGSILDKPAESLAWTHIYGPKNSRVFYTSLGHPDDFKEPAFRRLLLNGICWALNVAVPNVLAAPSTQPLKQSSTIPELNVASDLRMDLLLREPVVANPLYITFDQRGRMWLTQYRQYPWPAGLRMLSRDSVARNVYDPPFPPPPPFEGAKAAFRGADRITIHESTRHDGVFDKTTVFLDGLNLATAALPGRGGVFVLEAPYLLFYPCKNSEDAPDTQTPQVLLSGFGIEDTHALANDLRWGPDGWIYGAQGSTVSAAIVRHGPDGKPISGEKPVTIMGQMIWRYHPGTHRFEVFAEGGGNAFGVIFDSKGRVFSGHNGGDTRGFHYIQGGYFRKGFDKHGALSNPYTFGYIRQMDAEKLDRFTHTFSIYEADALPPAYQGKLIAIAPHRHYIVASDITAIGSTFKTHDLSKLVSAGLKPRDDYFTPVDIQIGPEGALYIADWQSMQANHFLATQGQTNPDLGRIYRISGEKLPAFPDVNYGALDTTALVNGLQTTNRWAVQQILRVLGDRKDATAIPALSRMVFNSGGQLALDALWGLNLCGGFNEAIAVRTLEHADPHVRRWTVRLIGDDKKCSTEIATKMAMLARTEPDVEVRSQLACTAKRLPTAEALPIIAALLTHSEDAADQHIPRMLWWALEAHAADRDAALALFNDKTVWQSALRPEGHWLCENLMQRWAMSGTQDDLAACGTLLSLSPDQQTRDKLVTGFQRAFEGRMVPVLPEELARELARSGGTFAVLLGVRQHDDAAVATAISNIADRKRKSAERSQLIRALGDMTAQPEKLVPLLIELAAKEKEAVSNAALSSLQKYDRPEIGTAVIEMYGKLDAKAQPTAQTLLASRLMWSGQLMAAIDSGAFKARVLTPDTIDKLRLITDPQVSKLVKLHFPDTLTSTAEFQAKIEQYKKLISQGGGQPLAGKDLFYGKASCAACHTVFGAGGQIGPDLTSYDRRNLDSMLLAIVNPSAEIREGFEDYLITTTDGRTLDGFRVEDDGKVFILRGVDGQNNVIPVEQIKSKRVSPKSLMPEGLLDALNEKEVRDLFAFLASTTPPK